MLSGDRRHVRRTFLSGCRTADWHHDHSARHARNLSRRVSRSAHSVGAIAAAARAPHPHCFTAAYCRRNSGDDSSSGRIRSAQISAADRRCSARKRPTQRRLAHNDSHQLRLRRRSIRVGARSRRSRPTRRTPITMAINLRTSPLGRIPADSAEELAGVVRKIVRYEQHSQQPESPPQLNLVAGVGGFGSFTDALVGGRGPASLSANRAAGI